MSYLWYRTSVHPLSLALYNASTTNWNFQEEIKILKLRSNISFAEREDSTSGRTGGRCHTPGIPRVYSCTRYLIPGTYLVLVFSFSYCCSRYIYIRSRSLVYMIVSFSLSRVAAKSTYALYSYDIYVILLLIICTRSCCIIINPRKITSHNIRQRSKQSNAHAS